MSKNKKTNVIAIVAVFMVMVLLVGALGYLSAGFRDWKYKDWFKSGETITEEDENATPAGVLIVEDSDTDNNAPVYIPTINDVQADGTEVLPASLSIKTVSSGMQLMAQNSVSLSVIPYPATATGATYTWSAVWQNPGSEWASGKNVSSYVTVTPSSGGKGANVDCLQAFGEKIAVTATYDKNATILATCLLNYESRINMTSLKLQHESGDITVSKDNHLTPHVFGVGDNIDYTTALNYTRSIGTLDDAALDLHVGLLLHDGFASYLSNFVFRKVMPAMTTYALVTDGTISFEFPSFDYKGYYSNNTLFDFFTLGETFSAQSYIDYLLTNIKYVDFYMGPPMGDSGYHDAVLDVSNYKYVNDLTFEDLLGMLRDFKQSQYYNGYTFRVDVFSFYNVVGFNRSAFYFDYDLDALVSAEFDYPEILFGDN